MSVIDQPWTEPGRGSGLLDVVRRRYLLKLLVRKELRVRYRGSVLGLAWSYVKPAIQYLVYFLALGIFLNLRGSIEDYPVYLFSGLVVVNVFSEAFANATRAVVWNAPLVKKIFLPRELFPVASVWVAGVHFVPQVVVLLVGAVISGWRPELVPLLGALVATAVIAALATGLGLLFGSLNVVFRDMENFVDLALMVVVWLSPVLYTWQRVADVAPGVDRDAVPGQPRDRGGGAVPLRVLVARHAAGPERPAAGPAARRGHRRPDRRRRPRRRPGGLPAGRGPLRDRPVSAVDDARGVDGADPSTRSAR